jgi:hypothetical protein
LLIEKELLDEHELALLDDVRRAPREEWRLLIPSFAGSLNAAALASIVSKGVFFESPLPLPLSDKNGFSNVLQMDLSSLSENESKE